MGDSSENGDEAHEAPLQSVQVPVVPEQPEETRLLVRKTLMEVQPPPEVSYTLNATSPADMIEARVIKVSSVPPSTETARNSVAETH